MKKKEKEVIETSEKQNKEGKGFKVFKTVFNVIINIMIVLILVASVLIAALSLTSKADPNGLPNVFGFTFQYVETNSMAVEPPNGYEGGNFCDQDVIVSRVYSPEEFPNLKVGDIITYRSGVVDDDGVEMMITHRIVEVVKAETETGYKTKGDAVDVVDQIEENDYLPPGNIVSVYYTDKYHGTTLKGFADFFRTIRSQKGFFGIILIPMIIFFLYAVIRVVISAMNYKKGKKDDEKELAEENKQKEIDAAVAAALAEKETEAEKPAEPAAPADMTPEQMEQFKQFLAFQEAQKAAEQKPADEQPTDTEPAEEE